jgi:succinate-semialdehyde dehydrogenase/glutarate-semialdehyde dehydrogenase
MVLELGGNDAMIVLDDANVDRAAAGAAWAGLSNCGQSCGGVQRIYAMDGIYGKLREALSRRIRSLRCGPDAAFDVDIGSLTIKQQASTIREVVEEAVAGGAVEVAKGKPGAANSALLMPALLLENVTDDARVKREETFGPVLILERVNDEEEAIRKANDSRYGLTASVWSSNPRRARSVAERLETGTVTINDHLMSHGMAETPWGGFKDSGIGRTHGEVGLEEVSQVRVIVTDSLHRLPRNMWWYPHDESLYLGLKAALRLLYGKGLVNRVKCIPMLIGTFARSFRKG